LVTKNPKKEPGKNKLATGERKGWTRKGKQSNIKKKTSCLLHKKGTKGRRCKKLLTKKKKRGKSDSSGKKQNFTTPWASGAELTNRGPPYKGGRRGPKAKKVNSKKVTSTKEELSFVLVSTARPDTMKRELVSESAAHNQRKPHGKSVGTERANALRGGGQAKPTENPGKEKNTPGRKKRLTPKGHGPAEKGSAKLP